MTIGQVMNDKFEEFPNVSAPVKIGLLLSMLEFSEAIGVEEVKSFMIEGVYDEILRNGEVK